jgi:hypothetical protein
MSTDSPDYMDDGFGDLSGMEMDSPSYVAPSSANAAKSSVFASEETPVVSYSGAKDWYEKAYEVAKEYGPQVVEQVTEILSPEASRPPVYTGGSASGSSGGSSGGSTTEKSNTMTYVLYGVAAVAAGLTIAALMGAFSEEK